MSEQVHSHSIMVIGLSSTECERQLGGWRGGRGWGGVGGGGAWNISECVRSLGE